VTALEAVQPTNCASILYKVIFFSPTSERPDWHWGPTQFPIERVPRGKNEAAISPRSLGWRLARTVTYLFPLLLLLILTTRHLCVINLLNPPFVYSQQM
jgi:hypothetical protein